MKQSVRDAFLSFTSPMEGVVPWMYLDIRGLITTAIGVLIDPLQYALKLPWQKPSGEAANAEEISAEWRLVKSHTELAVQGHRAAEHLTHLRLSPENVEKVVIAKADEMCATLAHRFPAFEDWPADAQLATLSMAWACGPGFHFGNLEAALKNQDFNLASRSCAINETGNPGIKPRNICNRMLYANAAYVAAQGLDVTTLYWPADLNAPPDAA